MSYASHENNWAGNNTHKTVTMTLKTVNVDEGIRPVLEWLNSKMEVFTLWSCQGDVEVPISKIAPNYVEDGPEEVVSVPAYAMFMCRNDDSFEEIRKTMFDFNLRMQHGEYVELETSLERNRCGVNTVHSLRIAPWAIQKFVEFIQTRKEESK